MTEETIFVAALEKSSPAERAAYLDATCAGDPELRRRVEALLQAHEISGDLLDPPPPAHGPNTEHAGDPESFGQDRPIAEGPGTRIGPYLIRHKIGEGGMGVVFLAEQEHPVRRSVALKVIKPGMDSTQVVARLEVERQALALMDHPHIAKFLDAGTTDSGRPFFVMEPVDGVSITEYCDQHRLTPRERLELFVPVCQAIQHAHQKGIIHRDVKPSNVLVTLRDGQPVAKVIDFGVAKAIDRRLTEQTLFTQLGVIVGTPEYMSPEQAKLSGLDVDTRSDIYSLGVLLYELLTGDTPLERRRLREAAFTEILRRVREEEPSRPSTRLSTTEGTASIAALRGTEPARLARLVRGDLDWIVMKALEKEPDRRYETADGLARDIQRHLEGDPVEAGPPSALYRLRKLAQKHRAVLATAMAFAAVLLAATAVSTWQAVRARRAEARARQDRDAAVLAGEAEARARQRAEDAEKLSRTEADKAMAINLFLTEDLLSQAEPAHNAAENHVTLLEVLDRAAAGVSERFRNQPDVEAAVRRTVAGTYYGLGAYDKSERHWRAVAELERQRSGPDSPEVWDALIQAGHVLGRRGQYRESVDELSRVRDALARIRGPDHPETIGAMEYLATAYREAGQIAEATPLFEEALRLRKSKQGPDDPAIIPAMSSLGLTYREGGRIAESIPLLEEALRLEKARKGPDHPQTLIDANNLALAYQANHQLPQAIALFEEGLQRRKTRLGPDHPDTFTAMNNLAGAYQAAGRPKDALPLFQEASRLMKAKLGPDHPHTLVALNNLALTYRDSGRLDQAQSIFEEVSRLMKAKLGPDHPNALTTEFNLGLVHQSAGRLDQALSIFEDVLRRMKGKLGPDHPHTLLAMYMVAGIHRDSDRPDQALPMLEEASRLMKAKLGPDHLYTSNAVFRLALTYCDLGRLDQAIPLLEDIVSRRKAKLGPDHLDTLLAASHLVRAELDARRWTEAETLGRECLEACTRKLPDDWLRFHAMSQLGAALAGQKKYAEAEPLLVGGYEGMMARATKIPAPSKKLLSAAAAQIVPFYEAWGKPDKAAEWRKKLKG
jgi:eukaryotic-like serine/threonine-protein kinase